MSNPTLDALLMDAKAAAVSALQSLIANNGPAILAGLQAQGTTLVTAVKTWLISIVPKNGLVGSLIGNATDAEINQLCAALIASFPNEEKAAEAFAQLELQQLLALQITV